MSSKRHLKKPVSSSRYNPHPVLDTRNVTVFDAYSLDRFVADERRLTAAAGFVWGLEILECA